MILKLFTDDGKRCVFAGRVPDDKVQIYRPPNAPAALIIEGFPIKDVLAELEMREVHAD